MVKKKEVIYNRYTCPECNSMPPIGRVIEVPKGKTVKDLKCPYCGKKSLILVNLPKKSKHESNTK